MAQHCLPWTCAKHEETLLSVDEKYTSYHPGGTGAKHVMPSCWAPSAHIFRVLFAHAPWVMVCLAWCAPRSFLIHLEEGLWVDIFQRRDTDLWPEHLKYTSTASSTPSSPKQAAKSNALASATRRFSVCLLVLCSNSDKETLSLLFLLWLLLSCFVSPSLLRAFRLGCLCVVILGRKGRLGTARWFFG